MTGMAPDSDLFKVREENGLRLIYPMVSTAMTNKVWTEENKWLRSRIEYPDGTVASQGFGKFLNLNQESEIGVSAQDIIDELEAGRNVVATLKYDGSCLIRSVINGKVNLRTRHSFSYDVHENADEIPMLLEKYPKLADPNFLPNFSLLFEWVTPSNQIVIKYPEPELYMIGVIFNGDYANGHHPRHVHMSFVSDVAETIGCPCTEFHYLTSVQDWKDLYDRLQNDKEIEGYVLRLNDEQSLVKVKTPAYLNKHGLKSNLSYKNMVEFWLQNRGGNKSLLDMLKDTYDEEIVEWAMPYALQVMEGLEHFEGVANRARLDVQTFSNWAKKDFVLWTKTQDFYQQNPICFNIAMSLWGNPDGEIQERMIRSYLMSFKEN